MFQIEVTAPTVTEQNTFASASITGNETDPSMDDNSVETSVMVTTTPLEDNVEEIADAAPSSSDLSLFDMLWLMIAGVGMTRRQASY